MPHSPLAILGATPARPAPIETTVTVSVEARQHIATLLESGRLSAYWGGPWSRRLEEAYGRHHHPAARAVATNSGTTALHLAVCAAGIGPGDEVIMPALCFVAAATSVVQNGGVPVICDAEPRSLTMDVDLAETLITPRTKAILAVHFWGYPAQVERLRALCDRHGLALIEDCAQSLGATLAGRPVGGFGHFATCAFSVRKHVACGEGGMVMCADDATQTRLRTLANYGKGPNWDDYDSLGYSYRLAEIPAVIALDGLGRLDLEIASRRAAAACYRRHFAGTGLAVLPEPEGSQAVYFKCPVLLPEGREADRAAIARAISAENVSCRAPHRPLYAIDWLARYLRDRDRLRGAAHCPVVARHHPRLIELETGPHLPPEEMEISAAAVTKVWRHL